MKIPFRQGIVRFQTDTNSNPIFLQKSNGGSTIDLYVNPDPTIVTFAHSTSDYLYEERKTVPNAWGPFKANINYWLYWDIDLLTGTRTFGSTQLSPIYSTTAPQNPTVDQHWFNKTNTTMFVWNGMSWVEKVRVFACKYADGATIEPFINGTQAGLFQTVYAGTILFDVDEKPVKQWKRDQTGAFLTTESKLLTHATKIANVTLEPSVVWAQAIEPIPSWSLVCYKGVDIIGLASHHDQQRPIVGMVQEDIVTTEVGTFVTKGYVTNNNWKWTEPPSTSLFCGPSGEITTTVPQIGSIQRVGMIVSDDTIFLDIGMHIILNEA